MKRNWITLTVIMLLLGCASDPSMNGINEADINAESIKSYREIKSKSKISTNKEMTTIVQRVAQRIAKASGKNYQWEVVLIDSPEINAWCMPGGKMAVYTGILPILKNEAALAAVMGHEVAHATLLHGMKGYTRAKQENYIGLVIAGASMVGGELLCKDEKCKQLAQLGGAAAGFAVTFYNRKFSREDETNADKEGQIYMARAGYNPSEAIQLWKRMASTKNATIPEFISTHPSDENRQKKLSDWLNEAQTEYSRAPEKFGLGEKF